MRPVYPESGSIPPKEARLDGHGSVGHVGIAGETITCCVGLSYSSYPPLFVFPAYKTEPGILLRQTTSTALSPYTSMRKHISLGATAADSKIHGMNC